MEKKKQLKNSWIKVSVLLFLILKRCGNAENVLKQKRTKGSWVQTIFKHLKSYLCNQIKIFSKWPSLTLCLRN